jgi:uncharacterized membrane protein
MGPGLAAVGQDQQRTATAMLGDVARQETERGIANQRARQAEKAGNVTLGSSIGGLAGAAYGMQAGSVGGPLGMAIGAAVGAIASGLF